MRGMTLGPTERLIRSGWLAATRTGWDLVISSADGDPDVDVVVEAGRFAAAVTYVCYCQWRRWKSRRGHNPHATSAGHATAKRQDLVWSGSVREISRSRAT